jgi:hypothetical protein
VATGMKKCFTDEPDAYDEKELEKMFLSLA